MKSEFVREQKRYTQNDLSMLFHLNSDNTVSFIRKLKSYGVLKMVKATEIQKDLTDLTDEYVEIVDVEAGAENYYYVFTFVGILVVGNIIIKCFPKYLIHQSEPLEEMKQVIKVLNKYNSEKQIINLYNGDDEQKSFNMLAVILYLLNDYFENGVYSNQQEIIETNGEGEILWDKTINETYATIIRNQPYYLDLKTQNTIEDDMDFFKRLHKCIITECSKKLKDADLIEIFEIEEAVLTEDFLHDLGNKEYILYRLEKELNIQYITRKQRLLKTLYAYIAHKETQEDGLGLSMYGTNSFNLIWEGICSNVFNNQLTVDIEDLLLPKALHSDYKEYAVTSLQNIIDKPIWKYIDEHGNKYDNDAAKTLKPDLISIYEKDDGLCFGIFDAKYYNLKLSKNKLEDYPGVGDVTKQYLYQLAYNAFILKHGFKNVQNAFIMPTESNEPMLIGEIEMEILKGLSNPPLQNILAVKIPAKKMYNWYLNNIKIDIHREFEFL